MTPRDERSGLDRGLTRRDVLKRAGIAGGALFLPGALARDAFSQTASLHAKQIAHLTLAVDWPQGGPPIDMTRGPGTNYEYYTVGAALEGLLYLDKNAKLQPRLAESWRNPDPLTYIFKVRRGVRFWDGTPLTLADVAYSFQRHQEKQWASNWSYAFPPFASIKLNHATNEITFKLKEPYVYFAGIAGIVPSYIVPKAFAKKHIRDIGTPRVLTMGTGPYRLTKYSPDDRIELVRNEHYWGAKPPVQRITLRSIQDDNARLLAFRAGQIDGSLTVPAPAAAQWAKPNGAHVIDYPAAGCWWIAFDRTVQPLGDVHVRRALAYSLDRNGLRAALFENRARLASTFDPPETWHNLLSDADTKTFFASLPQNKFDISRAKAELAASSVPNGFSLNVPVEADPTAQKIFEVWKAGAAQVGINLNLQSVSSDQYKSLYYERSGSVGLILNFWGTEYPDPMWNLSFLLPSANAAAKNWNLTNIKSSKLDSLLSASQSNPIAAARAKTVKQIISDVADDLGYYFLFWPDDVAAFDRRKVSVNSFSWWAYGSSVWTQYLRPPA